MAYSCCSASSRLFQRSTAQIRAFTRKTKSSPSIASNFNASPSRPHNSFFCTRLPVELAGGVSLMPLHSATASSLLRSMLSSKVGQWGSLSEGFATPL